MKTSSALSGLRQRGVATVEFAFISIAFFVLLLGILDMGRTLFMFNSAAEATRRGARTAAISSLNSGDILVDMQRIMPSLTSSDVRVSYLPSSCTIDTCKYVQVGLEGYELTPLFWPFAAMTLPSFQTTIPVESLGAD